MITNERQYRISKSQALKFREALARFNEIELVKQGIDPLIVDAQRRSLEEQLSELESDIRSYEELRSGRVGRLFPARVSDIGEKLIEARISVGLSQRELAERLGMKEQQVQRYEQERYLSANLSRVNEVAEALQLDFKAYLDVKPKSTLEKIAPNLRGKIDFDPVRLPIKEMKARGWLDRVSIPEVAGPISDVDRAAAFVSSAAFSSSLRALHSQSPHVRAGAQQDKYALLAWKAQVLHRARQIDVPSFGSGLDAATLKELVGLTQVADGPVRAVKMLRERGIVVIVERHLPSTHLDGAAMLLSDKVPVIGITLRFDRYDNFWFLLLHEVAHVVMHREKGLREGFFDEEAAPPQDDLEEEANDYARNALVPDELWKTSIVRFATSDEQVAQFAKKHGIGPAIVAGRIRRERNTYTIFNDLVGQGQVRRMMANAGLMEV